ncbi:MAG: terminase family protein [Pseudomonadota bacterium]
MADWEVWAHPEQLPLNEPWSTWLFLGGRGAGKTRAGAEWVRAMAEGRYPFAKAPAMRIAIIGETLHDAREVMVEGVSGLLSIHKNGDRPVYEASRRRVVWPNGAVAQLFSSETPDALRGPQFHAAWCDEIAKWREPEKCWSMLQFGMRLGDAPRTCVTTTPRPVPLLKRMLDDPNVCVTRASTRANAGNLSPGFIKAVFAAYGGTRLGRQELDGEIIEDREGALFRRGDIERGRVRAPPDLQRIVVALDPPATSGKNADACGIVVAGTGEDGRFYVIRDATLQRAPPEIWAAKAVGLCDEFHADRIVAEVNQGGEMVAAVLRQVDPFAPIEMVRATRGKILRAEPVAMLYAQGRVSHVGGLPKLEDEMCSFDADGQSDGHSPDRLDALVWALTSLMQSARSAPRIRNLHA